MSLSLGQLRAKVEPLFPEVQQIGDTVLRYIRKTERSAFAVYYLDVRDDLPQTQAELFEYLDRVVGEHYFEGASSLQWNSYLYFILSPDRLQNVAARKAKELVEQDRAYVRKFVISEPELDSVLRPKALEAGSTDKTPDAISKWISILDEAHLVDAVFSEHSLPDRMRLVEAPTTVAATAAHSVTTSSNILLPPIRQFEMKDFRRKYPEQRAFHFGDVNLLFGANGTGKTSLLEAIELFYCGKTRRNPKVSEYYTFNVSGSGEPMLVSHNRELQALRDNNLAWYGVREQKSTNLYDGFGRFNFLNTDASIELSQSIGDIEDNLAKLLIGSDASNTWQVIDKLSERVDTELKGLRPLARQVRQELDMLNKHIVEISSTKKESDSLGSALREALSRNQWTIDDDIDSNTDQLIAQFAELKAVSTRVKNLAWLDSPITIENFESYIQKIELIISACASHVENLKSLRVNQQKLAESVRRDQEIKTLIDEFSRLDKSGIKQRTSELAAQSEIITSCSSLIAGVDEDTVNTVAQADGNIAIEEYRDSAVSARKHAEEVYLAAKQDYDDFVKLRDRSLSLEQELREIAARILVDRPSDECPLCHTKFPAGELVHHITAGVDMHLEARAKDLLQNLRRAEAAKSKASATEKAAYQIGSLCKRMQLPPRTALKDAILSLNKVKVEQADAKMRKEALSSEISAMEAQGLSLSSLNEVSARLNSLGIDLAVQPQREGRSFKSDVEQRLTASRRQMESDAKEERRIQEFVSQATCAIQLSDADPVVALGELNERLTVTRAMLIALKRFLPRFRWEVSRPIAEWVVEAESVRGIAAQFQATLEKERIATKTHSDAYQRRKELHFQEKELSGRLNRLNEAQNALTKIRTKYSLKSMTESALQANRKSIEKIFAQIHSPAEFEAICPNWKLIRKFDGTKTPLTMISTGQRAAFALSVFLAQNAQLMAGPRVILIDDPIAHVDDLNCLSFLDYLREIALTGTRQIFFATANDKLASLFERKFDFLGDKFMRFDFKRAIGD